MNDIIIRKMQIGDHISLKKNVFLLAPIEIIENNVKNNVKSMEDNGDWTYFVAEHEGEVVGTMYLEKKSHSFDKHMGELVSVVTAESYQQKGVCKKLFIEVSKYAKEIGLEQLILYVRTGTIAETVYERLGFIKCGELPNGIKEENRYFNRSMYYYILK
jgi:N-acetylglutamate synthase-like GNAT family acetyltransferase